MSGQFRPPRLHGSVRQNAPREEQVRGVCLFYELPERGADIAVRAAAHAVITFRGYIGQYADLVDIRSHKHKCLRHLVFHWHSCIGRCVQRVVFP
jgi:hypothetical protein